MAKRTKLPGLSIPTSFSSEQRAFLQALVERAEVQSGDRGSAVDRAVTIRDLVDAGLASSVTKGKYATLRALDSNTVNASGSSSGSGFSAVGWTEITGYLQSNTPLQILSYDSTNFTYARIPTRFLASALGLVDTTSPQEINAPWNFLQELLFNGEQVVSAVGHGLTKTDEEIGVDDASLVIDWSQLTDVPTEFPPEAHSHPAAGIEDTVISPAQLTADQNDWAPADIATASIVRVSTDASRTVTGMVPGIRRTIVNVGANDFVVTAEDALSSAVNRFITGTTLGPNDCATYWYDSVTQRWRLISLVT